MSLIVRPAFRMRNDGPGGRWHWDEVTGVDVTVTEIRGNDALAGDTWISVARLCRMVAIDPSTGRHVRPATAEEGRAYWRANMDARPGFETVQRIGDVLVDVDTGPGVWFGGAGF